MKEYSQYIKSNFIHHEPRELLPMPVSILLGVSAKAGESLKSLQIFSVFDLATSHIFANAKKIVEVARSTNTTFGRYGGVPADVVDNDGHYLDVTELHLQPVELLEGVGPHNGPVLVDALQVQTIRDLALWPPYVAAFNIVTSILTPEDTPEFDPEAPPDLIPKSGEFPTEKVFYSTVVIDEIEGQDTVELSGQVDIAAIGAGDVGFTKPATGAIITMEQAWYAQGVALGNLLHSVALAPGESTKIAMVDWSRQTSASTDEDTSQVEALSSGSTHNRSISEVTNAVATEAQGGFSNTTSVGTSASTGMALGGLPPGPSPLLVGASQSGSVNASTATTVSASAGRRDLMASMNQNVADRTQQHANSARTRRASVVQEVSQKESETLTTRTVTNYNHMHALSIQYYEVVQIYRTTTRVNSVEKCLFIPMKPVDFSNMNSIDRFREILSAYAFTDKARLALDTKIQLVEIERLLLQPTLKEKNDEQLLIEAARSATGSHVAPDTSHTSPLLSWQLHKEVLLHRIEGGKLAWKRIFVTRIGKSDMVWERQQDGDKVDITLDTLVPLAEIDSIYIEYYGNVAVKSSVWILTLDFEGRKFQHKSFTKPKTEDYVQVEEGYTLDLFRFNYSGYTLSDWLLKHLDQNRLYYSQAIWMNMGSATLSILLSQYTYNEKPLLQQIDPIPVAMTGNYVGFRMNADPTKDDDWRDWLVEHGYYEENGETPKNTAVHETVPLPSGGVFAEAVLGRFNAAEKL
ncbi:MAG: hypothetical protein GY796_25915, partial [Chloroflexi bacterium]|nr:hypothetical protein [Chloroflexota bacterium]